MLEKQNSEKEQQLIELQDEYESKDLIKVESVYKE